MKRILPSTVSQPAALSKRILPSTASQPAALSKRILPSTVSQPAALSKRILPSTASRPAALSKRILPSTVSQPAALSKRILPSTASQPGALSKRILPSTASRPAALSKRILPSTAVLRAASSWRVLMAMAILLAASSLSLAQRPHLITHWENFTAANGMPDPKVFCVAVDGNRVWAGTEDGLALVENGKVQRVYNSEDGLVHRAVMGVAVDKKTGDLWIATLGGVSHLSGGQFQNFTNLTSGLLNDVCYGIAVVEQYVWVATTAGVSRLNTYTGEWTNWSEKNAPFHEPWSYGIAPAGNKMYFAIWGGGLLEYDVAGNYWKPYTDPDEEMEIVLFRNQGLIHIIVSNVAYNPDTKMVWASTYFGLSGYDGRDWHNYLTKDSGLASDFINAPKSRRNEVWACTDKGLSYLDYKTNTWVNYRPAKQAGHGEIEITWPDMKKTKLETSTTLAHNYILNMDFQGEDVWVATAQGLSHGIREPQKEAQLYESVRIPRGGGEVAQAHPQEGR